MEINGLLRGHPEQVSCAGPLLAAAMACQVEGSTASYILLYNNELYIQTPLRKH